jgi:tetratricopeptide (TPR) repeat protein
MTDSDLDIDPTYGDAWQAIGYVYKNKEDHDKAYEAFSKAIKISPTLANLYYERAYITAYIRNDLKGAVQDYENVIKYDPNSPTGYLAKGIIEHYRKDYDKAINSYTKAEELIEESMEAYGKSIDKNDLTKLLANVNELTDLSLKVMEIITNRGIAYYDKAESLRGQLSPDAYQRLLDTAITDYNEVIKEGLGTKNARAYCNRGIAYAGKQYYRQAIKDAEMFLKLTPNHPRANEIQKLIAEWREKRK